jgi:multiple sugar transport system permease protein
MARRRVLWILPALVVLVGLSIYPLIYSLKVSFTSQQGDWTLGNYARLFHDHLLFVSAIQTVIYVSVALAIELGLGLFMAIAVDSLGRGRTLFRAGFLAPMLLPPVVAAVIWRLIYNPQFGVLNSTLKGFGFATKTLTWTSGESSAMASVILVDIWEWTPFMFLLVSAGLQSIPLEPCEAAKMDGASPFKILRDIILPLLRPTLFLAILLRAMDLLRIFDQIWILTQGGPGQATETISLYIYRTAFRFFNFGYAASMSLVSLVLISIFAKRLFLMMQPKVAQ